MASIVRMYTIIIYMIAGIDMLKYNCNAKCWCIRIKIEERRATHWAWEETGNTLIGSDI